MSDGMSGRPARDGNGDGAATGLTRPGPRIPDGAGSTDRGAITRPATSRSAARNVARRDRDRQALTDAMPSRTTAMPTICTPAGRSASQFAMGLRAFFWSPLT